MRLPRRSRTDLRRKHSSLFVWPRSGSGRYPTPGVGLAGLQRCMAQESQASLLDLVNLFSGGALYCSSRSSRWASCPTSPRRLSSNCCGS